MIEKIRRIKLSRLSDEEIYYYEIFNNSKRIDYTYFDNNGNILFEIRNNKIWFSRTKWMMMNCYYKLEVNIVSARFVLFLSNYYNIKVRGLKIMSEREQETWDEKKKFHDFRIKD